MKTKFLIPALLLPLLIQAQNTCATAVSVNTGTHTTGAIDGTNFASGCWEGTSQEGDHAEWYKYSPTQDGIARINTNLPENDGITNSNNTKVAVYTGSCGALNCYSAEGEILGAPSFFADIEFEVRAGIDYYIAFDDFWSNKKLAFQLTLATPDCNSTFPFSEKWLTHLDFTCWKTYNTSESNKWVYYPVANFNEDPTKDPVAASYTTAGTAATKNDWLISSPLELEAGNTYNFSIKYNAMQYGATPVSESFRALILNDNKPQATQVTVIGQVSGIVQEGAHVEPYNMDLASTVTYSYTPATTGEYYFGIHANSPQSTSMLIIYEINAEMEPLSTNESHHDDFTIYPNPAASHINISSDSDMEINTIEIADLNGRMIQRRKYSAAPSVQLDITALQSGIYLMKVISGKGIAVKKIVKQ